MTSKRSLSVDIAKGISIIAIVLGHIDFLYPAIQLVNTKDLIDSTKAVVQEEILLFVFENSLFLCACCIAA